MVRFAPDDRWRRGPTLWLFAVQAMAVLVVLGMTANDIGFDVHTRHSAPSHRLVRTLVCSIFSLLSIAAAVALLLLGALHPLLVVAANTVLGFWWLWVTFAQRIAMDNLSPILRKLCGLAWRNRWLWCQNPKMEFAFSVVSCVACVLVVAHAAWTWKRSARVKWDAAWMKGGFGWSAPRAKYSSVDLTEDLLPSPSARV